MKYMNVMQNKIFIDVTEEVVWDVGMLTAKCLRSRVYCIAEVLFQPAVWFLRDLARNK